jgi:murein DD-endopeptidase MepM/ murein hydrolase activator NlpD
MSEVGPQGEGPSEQESPVREPRRPLLQVVLLAGLVALFGLVSALPPERHREVLAWVTARDGDLAGRWATARAWAAGVGGTARERLEAVKAGAEELVAEVMGMVEPKPGSPAPEPGPVGPVRGVPEPTPASPAPASPAPSIPESSATKTTMPVPGKLLYDYGWLPQGQEPHRGLDFAAAIGEPVLAIADGTVLRVAADPALGGFVEVDHGFIIALYGQVGGSKVKAGDQVTQGQTLATIAAPTGKEGDREAHLHLEVRVSPGAKPVDPAPFLPMSTAAQGGIGN